jgi:hypothetical protein
MEPVDCKAVVRDFWQKVFNEGKLDVVDELFALDHVLQVPNLLENATGPDAIKTLVALPRTVSPNIKFTVEDWVVEGERVVASWEARGTLASEMMRGTDYDNDEITASGVTIHRVFDGKIAQTCFRFDARVEEPRRPLRGEIREFVVQGIQTDPDDDIAAFCCIWTGCRCTNG